MLWRVGQSPPYRSSTPSSTTKGLLSRTGYLKHIQVWINNCTASTQNNFDLFWVLILSPNITVVNCLFFNLSNFCFPSNWDSIPMKWEFVLFATALHTIPHNLTNNNQKWKRRPCKMVPAHALLPSPHCPMPVLSSVFDPLFDVAGRL